MIKGDRVVIRTVRAYDLTTLYALNCDVESCNAYTRRYLPSEAAFRNEFAQTGFFGDTLGHYLVTDHDDGILGDIIYFSVNYMDGYEIGYCLYDTALRGQGLMTEALNLAVRHLFETRKVNRLQIVTTADNEAAKRLALRCGFRLEATLRGFMFLRGRNENSLLYSLLRHDLDR